MSHKITNQHNLQQHILRLEREIAHFRTQVEKFSSPSSPREQAALTLSTRKLADRERALKKVL